MRAACCARIGTSRAYNQWVLVLREQGQGDVASRFYLREQRFLRRVALREGKIGDWLVSTVFNVVAGYGERPLRTAWWYVVAVLSFAASYFIVTNYGGSMWPGSGIETDSQPLKWYEALVLSVSSFHGRGFFPQSLSLGDPIAVMAAIEAIVGLLIEIVLIATVTRRFFSR